MICARWVTGCKSRIIFLDSVQFSELTLSQQTNDVLFSGMYPTSRSYIRGWITDLLEGPYKNLWGPGDFTSGLVSVPLTLQHPSGVQDSAALVAGMLGFTVHRTPNSDEVSVQPFQGWSLMLGDDSPFLQNKRK